MRLLIDANIVLDVLQKREPHFRDSSLIWKLCETNLDEGFVSALSFADLVYIMRKELDTDQIKDLLYKMKRIFRIADFSVADLEKAADYRWPDFEDAVQSATAERLRADCIITRNVRDFSGSRIAAFTPSEYLARYYS